MGSDTQNNRGLRIIEKSKTRSHELGQWAFCKLRMRYFIAVFQGTFEIPEKSRKDRFDASHDLEKDKMMVMRSYCALKVQE
jgi:hypothetical protein